MWSVKSTTYRVEDLLCSNIHLKLLINFSKLTHCIYPGGQRGIKVSVSWNYYFAVIVTVNILISSLSIQMYITFSTKSVFVTYCSRVILCKYTSQWNTFLSIILEVNIKFEASRSLWMRPCSMRDIAIDSAATKVLNSDPSFPHTSHLRLGGNSFISLKCGRNHHKLK